MSFIHHILPDVSLLVQQIVRQGLNTARTVEFGLLVEQGRTSVACCGLYIFETQFCADILCVEYNFAGFSKCLIRISHIRSVGESSTWGESPKETEIDLRSSTSHLNVNGYLHLRHRYWRNATESRTIELIWLKGQRWWIVCTSRMLIHPFYRSPHFLWVQLHHWAREHLLLEYLNLFSQPEDVHCHWGEHCLSSQLVAIAYFWYTLQFWKQFYMNEYSFFLWGRLER